jgi:predicted RNase H-like HicB family nuclease
MSGKHDIEIGFDDEVGDYYAIWHPPTAVGSGSSMAEALRDLRDVIGACIDYLIERKLAETRKEV